MTYYGRWTYKYEIAAQKGAVGGDHHPRDGACRLSLLGGRSELGEGKLRNR